MKSNFVTKKVTKNKKSSITIAIEDGFLKSKKL